MRASLVALSVIGSAVVALAGCGGGDKSGDYPAAAKNNFINACEASSGGRTTYCHCAFDKIQAKLSYDEFKKEDAAVRVGHTPSRTITDAMAECTK